MRARPRFSQMAVAALVLTGAAAPLGAQVVPLEGRGEGADVVAVRDDWIAFEPLTVEDLLFHVPGIILTRSGSLGSRLYVDVAGSPTGRVRLAIDGIVYDEPEMAWARILDVPVAAIERVEVHRFSDPARIEVWTRQARERAPITEIELERGGLETRTRRVQLQTPRRAWWASARYDEVLQGVHDFRSRRTTLPPAQSAELGTFNGRNRQFELGFERPDDEQLRYRFEQFVDNSIGSVQSAGDFASARRTLNALRWARAMGTSRWTFEASYMAWERSRAVSGQPARVDESRGTLALDVDVPYGTGHRHSLRLRANDHEAVRDDGLFTQFQQYDVELQTHRGGSGVWNAWLAWHRHENSGNSWSARLHTHRARRTWSWEAQAGRGVSFAGWGESGDTSRERPGVYGSLGLARTRATTTLRVSGFAKHLEHQTDATALFFPTLGRGPESIAGVTGAADWRDDSGKWLNELSARLAWIPWVDGDRGGHPHLQAELRGRWTRLDLFDGDLVVTLQTLWHFETAREFTDTQRIAAAASGDVRMHLRVLQRMLLFWNILNVVDTRYETHPGVLMPERRSLYGVRVRLIN